MYAENVHALSEAFQWPHVEQTHRILGVERIECFPHGDENGVLVRVHQGGEGRKLTHEFRGPGDNESSFGWRMRTVAPGGQATRDERVEPRNIVAHLERVLSVAHFGIAALG